MPERRLKVMIVEDELTVTNAISSILRERYELVLAASEAEAKTLARQSSPDVVLCDASLATANQGKLIEALKKATGRPDLPIVLMSGYLLEPEAFGATAFLQKPFAPSEVFRALDAFAAAAKKES
jgi:CheY-like chemotaxis protein